MITKRMFGTTSDGREVFAYTLHDGEASVTVLNLGGIVQKIVVPDRDGKPTDVALGYHDVAGYENNGGYLGAIIGRFGNRIEKGRLVIDGVEYSLYCNDKGNHLHGGKSGFDKKIWDVEIDGDALILRTTSCDGEENYPGNLDVSVTYTLQEGELKIKYYAVSDKKTAINLTNHTYFNLNGEGEGDVHEHVLCLESDEIAPTNELLIPQGGLRPVRGTAFDFNLPKEIGRDINADDSDLKKGNGYDHCFLLKNKCGERVEYAVAESRQTGIRMTCATDMPAVQLYTGNFLEQEGKSGYYGPRSGFCLETQAIPNNVNVPEYAERGSSIYAAGQEYRFTASYKFTTK